MNIKIISICILLFLAFSALGSLAPSGGLAPVGAVRAAAPDALEYIIIGPQDFTDEAAKLVLWKTQKGVPARYYATETIYSDYAGKGGDELFKLREFLKDQKSEHPELDWVLLMGDSDVIPIRDIYAGAEKYNMLQFYMSDHYLAGLNGSWDGDSDGIYGEQETDEDWDSDIYVGRLPVGTEAEVTTAVEKILNYERSPPAGDWYTRALIMGSLMDAPNEPDRLDTPAVDEGYNEYKDNAFEVKKKSLDFFPTRYSFNELYDYDRIPGGDYSVETDLLTRENAVAEFNKGYALINFAGQARFNGDSLMQYEYEGGTGTYEFHRYIAWRDLYRYEDARAAKNGGMLPFMMMPTCDAANFTETDDTNLEVLFTAASGGAIGLISSTGVSHRGESFDGNSYGNWWEDEQFWKLFFVNDIYRPGRALAELKNALAEDILANSETNPRIYREAIKGNLLGLTLLGDPEIPIWTDTPKDMYAVIKNLTTGATTIEILVEDNETGQPVSGALVALMNNDIYLYGTTDENGNIAFNTTIGSTGNAQLTVTAHNYLPIERTEEISLAHPMINTIGDLVIDEDSSVMDYINLAEIVYDADTPFDDLEIILTSEFEEAGVKLNNNNGIDIVPEANWFGTSMISLSVSDGDSEAITKFNVNVISVNDPPILSGVPEKLVVWEDTLKLYNNITAFDPDSTDLVFYDDTELFAINSSTGAFSFIPSDEDAGEHDICIFVTDSEDTAKACFTITIFTLLDAPAIAPIGDLAASSGEKFSYQVVAADDDGDNLTYSVDPDWIVIDPETGRLYFTPDDSHAGNHEVTVYVTDGTHTTSETFNLVISTGVDYRFLAIVITFIAMGLTVLLTFLLERHKKLKQASEKKTDNIGKKKKM
jgi:hypothetical protein